MTTPRFYLVAKDDPGFESPDAITLPQGKHLSDFQIVRGVAGKPRSQIAIDWNGDDKAVEKKRERKAPKEPTAAVREDVLHIFAVNSKLTKAQARAELPQHGSDTVDNAIDWLTAQGKLTRTAKTYRAAKDAAPGSAT